VSVHGVEVDRGAGAGAGGRGADASAGTGTGAEGGDRMERSCTCSMIACGRGCRLSSAIAGGGANVRSR